MDENKLSYYENQPVRAVWDETAEEWYFSVVDVVQILTEQMDRRHAAKYWSVLKIRLRNEGMQLTTICSQLKMEAEDGKRYMTDTELVLNMLAEASTRDISKKEKPQGLEANRNVAKRGGAVAGTARKNLEKETGESVISNQNVVTLGYLVNNLFLDVVKDKEE